MENSVSFKRLKVIYVKKDEDKKVIGTEHTPSGKSYECHLSDSWYQSKVFPGDILNVKSDIFDGSTYIINDDHGLVTIDPDNLIPVGTISTTCRRKAWLDRLFKMMFSTFDEPSTVGAVVRVIFQTACRERPTTLSQLKAIRRECFEKETIKSKCSKSDSNKELLIEKVDEYLPCIMSWLERYVLFGAGRLHDGKSSVKIDTVEDIEADIWSPSLGIIGKVSAECGVKIHERTSRRKIVPFTLKTGKAFSNYFSEHADRSKLCSMLMGERGSIVCEDGLLLYLKNQRGRFEPVMNLIKVNRHDETRLLQRRNELAYLLSQKRGDFIGPDFLEEGKLCWNCPQRFNCSLLADCFEMDKIQRSSNFRRNFIRDNLKHLEPREIMFFKEWMESIRNEWSKREKDVPFWLQPSSSRENLNLGLGGLKIQKRSMGEIILTATYSLKKTFSSKLKLLDRQVVIRKEESPDVIPSKVALFFGRIAEVRENEIRVTQVRNIVRPGLGTEVFRLDVVNHDDLPFFYYWSLSTLMSQETPWKAKNFDELRKCIINTSGKDLGDFNLQSPMNEERERNFLDQIETHRLLHRIFESDETIVSIIRVLGKARKSILIVSHDSIILRRVLLKLKSSEVDFVCFGMHKEDDSGIEEYTIEHKIEKEKHINQASNWWECCQKIAIVATTCSVLLHEALLIRRSFDISIILEADKISLPTILSPLFISEHSILIGDETSSAGESGDSMDDDLGDSLFKSLRKKGEATLNRVGSRK